MKTKNNGFKLTILGTVVLCVMASALVGCGEKGDKAPEPTDKNTQFKPGDPPPPPMKNGQPVEGAPSATAAPPMEGTSATQNIPAKK